MKSNCLSGVLLLSLSACGNASAVDARPLQGVVELDTVTLAFEVSGRVSKVGVDEGDRLEGTVLLAALDESLDRPQRDARAAELLAAKAQLALIEAGARSEDIKAAQVEIASVEAQEAVLARQKARQTDLAQKGAMPSATLDDFDAQQSALSGRREVLTQKLRALRNGSRPQEIEAARANVQALEAGLVAMDARLARFTLEHEGTADVLDVFIDPGEIAVAGAPAFTLADLDHPYVDVFVPQAEVAQRRLGEPMSVRIDSLAEALPGKVERIHHTTEFTPRYLFSEKERSNLVVRVRVRIDDPRHLLRAGVPAFVSPRPEEH